MLGFGHWELLIVLVIAILIFGVGKLPQVGSTLGKSIGNFKKGFAENEKVENEPTKKIEENYVD
jgi:sec-independent protein translocase protein TatA